MTDSHDIRPAATATEQLIVINMEHYDARRLIDLALALGARKVPAGGYAIMPIKLRHWKLLNSHGFSTIRRQYGWRFYAPQDCRPLTLHEALEAAHRKEDMANACAD